MAAISLFWYTNMAAVTSDENDLFDFPRVMPLLNPRTGILWERDWVFPSPKKEPGNEVGAWVGSFSSSLKK
jgi:hypothetical protein